MKYLNQFHKESEQRKIKKINDWKKSPADLQTVLANQKERERQNINAYQTEESKLSNKQEEQS